MYKNLILPHTGQSGIAHWTAVHAVSMSFLSLVPSEPVLTS